MFCKHNYQYAQGHFYCTKCGHRTYGHQSTKSHRKSTVKIIGISISVIIGIAVMVQLAQSPDIERNVSTLPDTRTIETEDISNVTMKIAPVPNLPDTVIKKTIRIDQPPPTEKTTVKAYLYDKQTLFEHALDEVNKDRADNGLQPVTLSHNGAAQAHAEDILETRRISHWMTNGEKPYMTYTRYGGSGSVGQNISFSGFEDPQECKQAYVICDPINPLNAIIEAEYQMMHNDEASNWGHRDNILDPNHTHVSFGVAYDSYTFVLVQNFEDNYIEFVSPIGQNPSDVRIFGNAFEGQLQNVSVYYDEYPTPELYQMHKYDTSYGAGKLIAIVEPPLSSGYYYNTPTGYHLIVAKSMSQNGHTINVIFDMSSVSKNRGVYTITVWLENNGVNIPATSYAMFVE